MNLGKARERDGEPHEVSASLLFLSCHAISKTVNKFFKFLFKLEKII